MNIRYLNDLFLLFSGPSRHFMSSSELDMTDPQTFLWSPTKSFRERLGLVPGRPAQLVFDAFSRRGGWRRRRRSLWRRRLRRTLGASSPRNWPGTKKSCSEEWRKGGVHGVQQVYGYPEEQLEEGQGASTRAHRAGSSRYLHFSGWFFESGGG